MDYLITESQLKVIVEEEQKVLHIPDIKIFGGWDGLQIFLESKGNPLYSLGGDLYLNDSTIKSLGNLTSVGGDLDLFFTPIESLENLTSVGGNLDLYDSSIESLGNLTFVGGDLYLIGTPISKKYSKEEIRQMVNVGGDIYL
jgi:hypothetical protein